MVKHIGFPLILLVAIAAAAGCRGASATVNSNQFSSTKFEARPAAYPIDLIPGRPTRPYIVIGHVSAVEKEFWGGLYTAQGNEALEKIRARARELGGDAVIEFETYTAPQGTVSAGSFTAQGTVVRW